MKRERGASVARLASALIAVFALGSAAHASGNEYSFDRAASAAVNYRATTDHAVMACEALTAHRGPATAFHAVTVVSTPGAPEHCRIDGVLPTGIGFQINLPTTWNGRVYMYGNGGYAGEDAESPREQASRDRAIANGFATARTDTGHLAAGRPMAAFALDRVALVNHAYGAVHATIAYAKALAGTFYGQAPRYSYWDGCSTGGREGVMSAQRFPADFDGIVAGAPTLDWTSIMIKGLWNRTALAHSGLTAAKMAEVFKAVMAKCDQIDGVRDGLIDDPRRCHFSVEKDLPHCHSAPANGCFTAAQLDALRKLYGGPPKGRGVPAWDYQLVGFEDPRTLAPFVMMPDSTQGVLPAMADQWMKYIAFRDPDYRSSTFDFHRDPARIRQIDVIFNPTPDLAAFEARGGKMITFWGWSDAALNPQMGLAYYDAVVARRGLKGAQKFYRLFLIPGMAHCGGGYGPNDIDAMSAVIDWVEKGIAPERLSARLTADRKVIYDRAYCAYPSVTRYRGVGNTEDPRNYSCVSSRPSR
jgi:feruloyl esterase